MRAAAIDIGTNSVKMVIGQVSVGDVTVSEVPPIVTRLGKGVDANGRLDDAAIERTLNALRQFATQATEAGVTRMQAVGTSALRDAANGDHFRTEARAILGVSVDVISGDREADLIYHTARQEAKRIAPDADMVVTTDVGGGSTEIVIGAGDTVTYRQSLQIGAVRLTERTLHTDPPTAEEYHAAVAMVDGILATVPVPTGTVVVIASGGTAANLGAMALAASSNTPVAMRDLLDHLHGLPLTEQAITENIDRLRALPLVERRTIPGLEPDRADVIIAGAIIQARILHHLHRKQLSVSVRGLRYGLLYEMLGLTGHGQ